MENKHFEPVPARSLAIKLYDLALESSKNHSMEYEDCIVLLAGVLEPHIRKPSDSKAADPNWIAKEIAAICLFRGEEGDSKFRRVRELVSPYIRTIEELHQSKSVPARCEEAYNEALSLLHEAADVPHPDADGVRTYFGRKVFKFLQKPNPFKEADIVKEDETGPTRVPFSLELAEQGHKVITRDGRPAKIVASDLRGVWPLGVVYEYKDGTKYVAAITEKGTVEQNVPSNDDLFILKEPETVEIRIFRHKEDGSLDAIMYYESYMNRDKWEFIKTITVTI